MKARKFEAGGISQYDCRIIKEPDFQKLVTLMKELRECVSANWELTKDSTNTINQFLDDNGVNY